MVVPFTGTSRWPDDFLRYQHVLDNDRIVRLPSSLLRSIHPPRAPLTGSLPPKPLLKR